MLSFASAASLSLSLSSPLRPMRSAARAPSVVMADMAVLFDCDGVLADTERDGHRVSFNKVFGEKGYSFEWGVDEYGKLCEVGGGKERMTHYFDIHGWPEGLQDVADTSLVKPKGLPVDAGRLALVTEMHKRKTALFMELINEGTIPLRPGVLAIVDEAIAADVPLAVCSTSNEAAVRTIVETQMGAERYAKFSFFCGDAVARKKPQPDVYNLAAETMGLDKAECVVVEDSGIGLQASGAAQFGGAQFVGAQFVQSARNFLTDASPTGCAGGEGGGDGVPRDDLDVHRRRRLQSRRPHRRRARLRRRDARRDEETAEVDALIMAKPITVRVPHLQRKLSERVAADARRLGAEFARLEGLGSVEVPLAVPA